MIDESPRPPSMSHVVKGSPHGCNLILCQQRVIPDALIALLMDYYGERLNFPLPFHAL